MVINMKNVIIIAVTTSATTRHDNDNIIISDI